MTNSHRRDLTPRAASNPSPNSAKRPVSTYR